MKLFELLKKHELVVSKAQTRRLILQGAISVNNVKMSDVDQCSLDIKSGDTVQFATKVTIDIDESNSEITSGSHLVEKIGTLHGVNFQNKK